MSEWLHEFRNGMDAFQKGGQFAALFLIGILFSFLNGKRKNRKFLYYAVILTLLICFPVTAFLLVKYRTSYYSYGELLSLLPVIPMSAWGIAEGAELISEKHPEFKTGRKLAAAGGIFVLIALCGTVSPFYTRQSLSFPDGEIPGEEREVIRILSEKNEEEPLYIWAPDEVLTWARVCDGDLHLLYGRDLWNPELCGYTYDQYGEEERRLHEWMNRNRTDQEEASGEEAMTMEEAISMASYCGCNAAVFKKDRMKDAGLEKFTDPDGHSEFVLKKIGDTEKYDVFQILK